MRRLVGLRLGLAALIGTGLVAGLGWAAPALHQRAPEGPAPGDARQMLVDGNARFVTGTLPPKDLSRARRDELSQGQKPFAVIVTCSDSRVPPELLFDQALGDLFVVRVAGNVADPVAVGSVEYAVEHLGAPLVVVMGHTLCGAVKATVAGGEAPGSIGSIVELITPAVDQAKAAGAAAAALPEASADANVALQLKTIGASPIVQEKPHDGAVELAGAKYDIASGQVAWL